MKEFEKKSDDIDKSILSIFKNFVLFIFVMVIIGLVCVAGLFSLFVYIAKLIWNS